MIGIVVCAADSSGMIDSSIYSNQLDRTIFEITVDNALKAEFAQRVIVCCPASQRTNIHGGGINVPKVRPGRSFLGRKASFHFYDDSEGLVGGIYGAAITHGLDKIGIIHANCPLLPTWLMNQMLLKHLSSNSNSILTNESYGLGFNFTILPFWVLAHTYIYSEDRNDVSFNLSDLYYKESFENALGDDNFIFNPGVDLRFSKNSNVEEFDYYFSELSLGADISDLILDKYNDKQEDS